MFITKPFISHSGISLDWKIDCDSLTDADWACMAKVATNGLKFKRVIGIPHGGLKFAEALKPYTDSKASMILIVDDVLTTGGSMIKMFDKVVQEEYAKTKQSPYVSGLVLFCRADRYPSWIQSVFYLHRAYTA